MSLAALSPNDAQTLNLLFTPDQSAVPPKPPISESLPQDRHYTDATLENLVKTEAHAVSVAEETPETALALLDTLLKEYPLYASAYNNRAQLLRLRPELSENSETQIMTDLDKAIELAAPQKEGDMVSEAQGRVLKNAYSQRGAIWVQRKLDEKAMRDFEQAARWGSEVAREYVVKNNPYAKMCGEMVKEVLRKEMGM
jgi:tetratricopeptide (TPR) repeat protein